jgi:multiple sugar transport system substrate-binding protein
MKCFDKRGYLGWGLAVLCGALLWAALAGGCSRKGSPTIRLSSWGDVKENAILLDLIGDFQKIHPEIKVELLRVPYDQYNTKVLSQVAGGNAPDVIFAEASNVAEVCWRGILEPLDEYVKNDPGFPLADFYPSILDRFTVDGKLFAIPRDISPVCLVYYNKKAFDAARLPYPKDDWNWGEFLADAKALTKVEGGRTVQWGFTNDSPRLEPWVYSSGGRWVDDVRKPTRYTFNSPEVIRGLQFRADLILKHKVMPSPANMTAMGGVAATNLFINGAAAMLFSGIWITPQLRDIKDFDWDVALFPKGPEGQRGYANSGSGYGILSSSKNKKAAWELVRYISGAEGEKKMASTGLIQPALKSLANSPVFLDGLPPLNKKILLGAEVDGVFDPLALNWQEILLGSITPALDRVWEGKTTAKEAVAQLAEDLKKKPLVTKAEK